MLLSCLFYSLIFYVQGVFLLNSLIRLMPLIFYFMFLKNLISSTVTFWLTLFIFVKYLYPRLMFARLLLRIKLRDLLRTDCELRHSAEAVCDVYSSTTLATVAVHKSEEPYTIVFCSYLSRS